MLYCMLAHWIGSALIILVFNCDFMSIWPPRERCSVLHNSQGTFRLVLQMPNLCHQSEVITKKSILTQTQMRGPETCLGRLLHFKKKWNRWNPKVRWYHVALNRSGEISARTDGAFSHQAQAGESNGEGTGSMGMISTPQWWKHILYIDAAYIHTHLKLLRLIK